MRRIQRRTPTSDLTTRTLVKTSFIMAPEQVNHSQIGTTKQQMTFWDLNAKWGAPRSVKADSSHPERT